MIEWTEQGAAAVGQVVLRDGRPGGVVLVAPRNNAKGATIVLPPAETGAKPVMAPFSEGMAHLRPADIVEILAMQERLFGTSGLPRPAGMSVGKE